MTVNNPYSLSPAEQAAYDRAMTTDWPDLARQSAVVPFTAFEGKALQHVEALADGDLLIDGWIVRYGPDFMDRQNEWFGDGALSRGLKAFLDGSAPLYYNHDRALGPIGKVLEAEEVRGQGVRFKARVDGVLKRHPTLGRIYEQIRRGTIRSASVGGYFKRVANKIADMDILEFSATALPVGKAGVNFEVVAGKALTAARPPVSADIAILRGCVLQTEMTRLAAELRAARRQAGMFIEWPAA